MNTDKQEQEDELLALQSIFNSDEFVRDESKAAGEIRVSVELPAGFTVAMKEGDMSTKYDISFLPPLLLTFELSEDYPSSSPPSFTLTCSWLTQTQLSALSAQLTDLYVSNRGAVVLFAWVQFLKEDALRFLDIHTLLELSSDEHSTQDYSQNSLHDGAQPQLKTTHHTPDSGVTDDQSSNTSDLRPSDITGKSLEDTHPIKILSDDSNATNSDLNDSNQTSDAREAGETPQVWEFKDGTQNHQASAPGKLKEGGMSASVLPPSSSSDLMDEAASLPLHPRDTPPSEDQTYSGLSLTPSQRVLSQILIYNAAQQRSKFATTVFECGVCFSCFLGSDCVQLPGCGHIFCRACLAQFCKLHITEGDVRGVTCPEAGCTAAPTPAQVKSLVGEDLFSRYDRLLLQKTLDSMPDVVYCPRLPCGAAVIQEKSSNAAMCSVCAFAFCVTCRKTYHGADKCQGEGDILQQSGERRDVTQQGTLDLPQSEEGIMALWKDYTTGSKQRRHLLESRYNRKLLRSTMEDYLSVGWITHNTKYCPHCYKRIQKDTGCNTMTCTQCGQIFCWNCLDKLSKPFEHFQNNPSCLFYY